MTVLRKAMLLAGMVLIVPAPVRALPARNPQLTAEINGVRDPAHAARLRLRRIDIAVKIHGAVAETTVEAAFANPGSSTLEGDFRLALPEGAVVTGYALDVRGAMVDGVLVDRPRAAAIYDARVRRGVDPGVAEIKAGNLFETRVHPILPGSGRRIRLRFVAPVPLAGLSLPLAIDPPDEGWSITIDAADAAAAPAVTLPDGSKARFAPGGSGLIASAKGAGTALDGTLTVQRAAPAPGLVSRHSSGEYDIQLAGELHAPGLARPSPGQLRIYWDRSRARLDSRLDDDLALVRQLIARSAPTAIELVAFNSSGAQRIIVGSAEAAVAWLKGLTYRGASSLAAIAGDGATDRCVLFANGQPRLDLAAATGFAPRCRLDAVSSAPGADQAWLGHVARAHGGNAHALAPGGAEGLADSLAAPFAGVVALRDRDGRAVPFLPLPAAGGHWLILARTASPGPLTVTLQEGDATRDEQRALPAAVADFDGVGALLAADRLAELTAPAQREAYVALSRRYGVASPSLSFLVLETPQDYLAAKIEPPAGLPAEWRDDYLRQRKAHEAGQAQALNDRLERVVAAWRDEVAWWKTRFDPQAKPKRVIASDHFERTEPVLLSAPPAPAGTPAPRVMAAPPPPPPPPPGAIREEAAQNIVVTAAMARRRTGQAAADMAEGAPAPDQPAAHIAIDAWQPDRPYLELYDGKPADFDSRFLEAEARHGTLPIFYLDTAEWLRRHDRKAEAVEMALSALELPSANEVTLGIVADRLERYGAIDRAIELRERAAVLDPDRPQPRRLLALALARRAALSPAQARADLARAVALLYAIATTPQAPEWDGIELIALNEANALLPRLRQLGGKAEMDPRLIGLLDTDLRVVIDWTTDGSDMDLWVDQPDHERAIYSNPRTAIGGRLSHDMTRGYGPEEYLLRHAPPGSYAVQANVYAPDRLDPNGATILTAHLLHDFGRPNQREESIDVELKRDEKGAKPIGTITIDTAKR
ncbi:MAG: hypothetical protein JSS36_02785 [Proteobacteria bacterium]|nr:hypothetical protein [Pseudomonadota bacterium]